MRVTGLTLIEFLITLSIVSVLAMAGVPALRGLIMDQRMTAQVNGFVHGVFMAKQSAHTRRAETVICKSPTGRH